MLIQTTICASDGDLSVTLVDVILNPVDAIVFNNKFYYKWTIVDDVMGNKGNCLVRRITLDQHYTSPMPYESNS